MDISRRTFAGTLAGMAFQPKLAVPQRHPHPADFLTYAELPKGYVTCMGFVIESICAHAGSYQGFVDTAKTSPHHDGARILDEQAIYKFGDAVLLLTGTDWRDLYLLIHDKRFTDVLDHFKIPYEAIFNEKALHGEILDDAVFANGVVRDALRCADANGSNQAVPLNFLNRHFPHLDEALLGLSRDSRLFAHFEQLCFSHYGVFIGSSITPAMAANYEIKCYGYEAALTYIESFICGEEARSFAGPHTLANQQPVLKQIKQLMLQKYRAAKPGEYEAHIAKQQGKHVEGEWVRGIKSAITAWTNSARQAVLPTLDVAAEIGPPVSVQLALVNEHADGDVRLTALPAPEISLGPVLPLTVEAQVALSHLEPK